MTRNSMAQKLSGRSEVPYILKNGFLMSCSSVWISDRGVGCKQMALGVPSEPPLLRGSLNLRLHIPNNLILNRDE